MSDCLRCEHWRSRASRIKGVTIPGGTGKCIRPEGHCNPEKPRGYIGGGHPEVKRK
jgi:hypothetical protein